MPRWVFGYGSLVWRPGFQYSHSEKATLPGWRRSLTQASPDHRGTPEYPGRVLTIIESQDAMCIGRAFRVEDEHWDAVHAYLEERESGGYTATQLPVRIGQRIVRAWLWIAFPDNPNFIRDESLETSLEVIRRAEGASGPNVDYVINLCDALHKSDIIDDHLIMISKALEELLSKDER